MGEVSEGRKKKIELPRGITPKDRKRGTRKRSQLLSGRKKPNTPPRNGNRGASGYWGGESVSRRSLLAKKRTNEGFGIRGPKATKKLKITKRLQLGGQGWGGKDY